MNIVYLRYSPTVQITSTSLSKNDYCIILIYDHHIQYKII